MIRKLIEKPFQENWQNKSLMEQYLALQHSIISNDLTEIQREFDEGIEVNATEENGEGNILMYYILNWNEFNFKPKDIIELLIRNGININHQRNSRLKNASALHYAITSKNIEINKTLVENDAHSEVKDSNGNTPLWRAIMDFRGEQELKEIIEYLINYGSSLDTKNESGISPRDIILRRKENINQGLNKKEWDLSHLTRQSK